MKFEPGQFVIHRTAGSERTGFIWEAWDQDSDHEPFYQLSTGDGVMLVPESELELSRLSKQRAKREGE